MKTIFFENRSILYDEVHAVLAETASLLSQNTGKALLFIADFLHEKDEFHFNTSGSTGKPKTISFSKKQLEQSARTTIDFLKLYKQPQHFFLCLDATTVAGSMLLCRALLLDADITIAEPSSNPLKIGLSNHPFTFASFVPLQLHTVFEDEDNMGKLNRFKHILVGGAPISNALEAKLSMLQTNVWHTYGMTETLSHIALRKVGVEKYFTTLPHVKISLADDDCILIITPATNNEWVKTTDIAKLVSTTEFEILGRNDFVINSGAYKIHPEEVEKKIASVFQKHNIRNNFFVAGLPDEKLGEKCVLIIEGCEAEFSHLQILTTAHLHPYQNPKEFLFLKSFVYTASQKVDRLKIIELLSTK